MMKEPGRSMLYNKESRQIRHLGQKLASFWCAQCDYVFPYKFAQTCQRRKKCWRSLSLLVYAIKHQHEFVMTP
jgi:enoyl-[acyl-carrier-protein] reductase (NADH)